MLRITLNITLVICLKYYSNNFGKFLREVMQRRRTYIVKLQLGNKMASKIRVKGNKKRRWKGMV